MDQHERHELSVATNRDPLNPSKGLTHKGPGIDIEQIKHLVTVMVRSETNGTFHRNIQRALTWRPHLRFIDVFLDAIQ